MSDWTDGYIAEIDYTYGFYRELTPSLIQFALLLKGVVAPEVNKPFNYCELGYGQGFGANLLAAANPHGDFWGTDFNPQHAVGARTLSIEAGLSNTHWFDDCFADFLERDLPDFDFICLHGIYSWVTVENRSMIVEFIRRRLKLGGVVYISYNSLPGWSSVMPLRQLLAAHAGVMGATGEPLSIRLQEALLYSEDLIKLNAGFFRANPGLAQRIEKLKLQNPNYLVHEYLNREWTPQYFSDVCSEMSSAKLTFAGSANFLDHVDAVNYSSAVIQKLNEIQDPVFKETVRDYVMNTQFRRDLYVYGKRTVNSAKRYEHLLDTHFMLQTCASKVKLQVNLPAGKTTLQASIYEPLLATLQDKPYSLREMAQRKELAAAGPERLVQALVMLIGLGHVQPCLQPSRVGAASVSSAALNQIIMSESARQQRYNYLAAPETGSAIAVTQISQLFLLAVTQGVKEPRLLAQSAWQALRQQGNKMLRDGKPLESELDNLKILTELASAFVSDELPVLRRLGVVLNEYAGAAPRG